MDTRTSSTKALLGPSLLRPIVLGLGLGLVYAVLAELVTALTSFSASATAAASFWPAAGVTVAALLVTAPRRWPWLLAGVWTAEFAVDVHAHSGVLLAAGWGAANVVEPLWSALLLRRALQTRPDLSRRRHLSFFLLCAVLAGPALGALVGASSLAAAGTGSFTLTWLRWFVGDGIGVLVVAPALLSWGVRRELTPGLVGAFSLATALALAMGAAPVSADGQELLAILVIPALLWTATLGGLRCATLGVLCVALITNAVTAAGEGPFADGPGAFHGLVYAQVFLGTVALATLLVAVLSNDLAGHSVLEVRMRWLAEHDALTGLANRRLLLERLAREVEDGTHVDRQVAMLMVDLDGFKEVNDRFGHACGDKVLVETARRLDSATRSGDVIARLGGDEFLIYLDHPLAPGEVPALASRLTSLIGEPIAVGDEEITLGASIGVAVGTLPALGPEALLRLADDNMYAVKRAHTAACPRATSVGSMPAASL